MPFPMFFSENEWIYNRQGDIVLAWLISVNVLFVWIFINVSFLHFFRFFFFKQFQLVKNLSTTRTFLFLSNIPIYLNVFWMMYAESVFILTIYFFLFVLQVRWHVPFEENILVEVSLQYVIYLGRKGSRSNT